MKKTMLRWSLGSIFLVLLLATPASAQQVIKLTMAEQNAEMGWGPVHAGKPFIKRLEEATKGRVKIDVFYSQTLAKGPDIWNAVKNGVADMGWCFHGYWADMTPLSDVITLPSLPFRTAEKGSEVLWKLYEKFPAIRDEFKDVHVITLYSSLPYFLITTKKQVRTIEDLKGMKIRVVGGPPTEQMKALGAIPTLIPMPDTYLSMDRGVIDGMGAPWEAVEGFRLYEIAKYYTMVPLSAVYFSISMNKQKWDSLPRDIQQAITKVGGLEAAKFWGKNWFDTAEEGVNQAAKKGKYQIVKYTPPAAELERWRKTGGEPLWAEWVKKMEAKGRPEAGQILKTALELLK
jgi:TRAP-type C4-dicarboxylate transport system substrate-binding protein